MFITIQSRIISLPVCYFVPVDNSIVWIWVWNLVSHIMEKIWTEGIYDYGAEENI